MSGSRVWQLVLFLIVSSSRVFSADNVCSRMENYTITSMETYTEPVVVNTFTWCLQIPPRCPKTRTETRQRYRVKTESKTRIIRECCEGYKTISSNNEEASPSGIKCVPVCEKCPSGICTSPNRCLCIPGYEDDNCDTVCPPGTWGLECKEKCNCTENVPCNPVNGHCVCPPGLRAEMCNEPCPNGRWGPGCAFLCDCKDSIDECHPETGRCVHDDLDNTVSVENSSYSRNADEGNSVTVNFTIVQLDRETSRILGTAETTTKDMHEILATTDNPSKTTSLETTNVSTMDEKKIRAQAPDDGNSSTAKPVVVWVSVPERRGNLDRDRGKFAMKNSFARHVDDNVDLQDIDPPKIDYVKNIHKDVQPAPISMDIALIVIASIVSLGLTSVTVVMVLHMRWKLLEATRISIYEEAKTKNQENSSATKISSIVTGTLPQTPIRLVPLFAPESIAMPSMTNDDLTSNYANGAATIGLRISGNLHGLLQEDHYDRPSATRIHLQSDFDSNTEHVYDEIPLQSSPLNFRKNT